MNCYLPFTGIPHYEQIINMFHDGRITNTTFNQLLLQDHEMRQWWEHYKILDKALKDEEFVKLLRD
ncbi:MAG: hypothetical protein M0Q51_16000 [Bacteroidales bacterium]|nr:hypothetical protein [Bacteroidales bacterium]